MSTLLDFLTSSGGLLRDVVLPIFVLIFAGWLADRKFDLDLDTLVKLNIYVFVPAFIFVRVSSSGLTGTLAARVVIFTLCISAAMFVLSTLTGKILRLDRREQKAHQLSTMFYNSGNYGIPLMTLAYPVLGPTIQPFVLLTMNVSCFSVGIFLASTQNESSHSSYWRHFLPALRQPTIYAIAAAFTFRGLEIDPARAVFLWEPLNYIAGALVSFALVTLGVQLSKRNPPRIEGHKVWCLVSNVAGRAKILFQMRGARRERSSLRDRGGTKQLEKKTADSQISPSAARQSPSQNQNGLLQDLRDATLGSALAIRLLGGPAVAVGLTLLFGFEGEVRDILILSTAVPTAVNTALLAHEFKADSAFAASAVFYSTLLSLLTVTLILALLR